MTTKNSKIKIEETKDKLKLDNANQQTEKNPRKCTR